MTSLHSRGSTPRLISFSEAGLKRGSLSIYVIEGAIQCFLIAFGEPSLIYDPKQFAEHIVAFIRYVLSLVHKIGPAFWAEVIVQVGRNTSCQG